MPSFSTLRWVALAVGGCVLPWIEPLRAAEPVDFNRDIRSVLSNTCFKCHGPDEAERQADLRFDTREGALANLEGHAAIVPGQPEASEILKRITSTDPEVMMPPPGAGRRVTPQEVELIRRWIAEGAHYSVHWAYQSPKQSAPPETPEFAGFAKTDIDRFVAAKLKQHGLAPSGEADRATLIRRVSLDLTGLQIGRAHV